MPRRAGTGPHTPNTVSQRVLEQSIQPPGRQGPFAKLQWCLKSPLPNHRKGVFVLSGHRPSPFSQQPPARTGRDVFKNQRQAIPHRPISCCYLLHPVGAKNWTSTRQLAEFMPRNDYTRASAIHGEYNHPCTDYLGAQCGR